MWRIDPWQIAMQQRGEHACTTIGGVMLSAWLVQSSYHEDNLGCSESNVKFRMGGWEEKFIARVRLGKEDM
jgi:hypothetical protein